MQSEVEQLRALGWSVAVHNDYRLHGVSHTFWLWTHPNGRYVKGEGATDEEALQQCLASLRDVEGAGDGEQYECPHCAAVSVLAGREWLDSVSKALDDVGAPTKSDDGTIIYGITQRIAALLQPPSRREGLFEAIAHGDEDHRAWLKEALDCWFAGQPVPPPALPSAPGETDDAE